VTTFSHGPCHPNRIEIPAAAAFDIIIGTRKGETRRAPCVDTDLFFDRRDPDPGRDDDGRRARWPVRPSPERHRRRGQGELREPVGAPRVLRAVEPLFGVEVEDTPLTLGRRPEQPVPELVLSDAAGRDHPDAGDCDAPALHDDPDRYFEVMSW
jgi:hypothetical protein